MQTAKKYLETLYQREPQRFPAGMTPSPLTEHDIHMLEDRVGYPFPEQYRNYLLAYQVPRIKTDVRLCSVFFYIFSKEKNAWVPEVTQSDVLTVDFDWGGEGSLSKEEYWERRTPDEEPYELMDQFLRAGYILVGVYHAESYFVFYDLVAGTILHIHNEDIWEEAPLDMLDDFSLVRPFMADQARPLCPDFDTFLRLVCTGEVYDEDHMMFITPT